MKAGETEDDLKNEPNRRTSEQEPRRHVMSSTNRRAGPVDVRKEVGAANQANAIGEEPRSCSNEGQRYAAAPSQHSHIVAHIHADTSIRYPALSGGTQARLSTEACRGGVPDG